MFQIRAQFTSHQNCKNTSIKRPKRGRARGNGEEQDRASRTKRKSKYQQLFLMIKSGAWLLHSSIGEGRGRREIVLTNVSSRSSPSLPRLLHALRLCNPIQRGRGSGLQYRSSNIRGQSDISSDSGSAIRESDSDMLLSENHRISESDIRYTQSFVSTVQWLFSSFVR